MGFLILVRLCYIEPQPIRIQIQLVLSTRLLKNLSNVPCVLDSPEIYVASALLNGVTDEFCGAGFTLGAYDRGLFFLAGFIDHEGGTLRFLLGDLLRFHCGSEFGGESEVLGIVSS